MTSTHRPVVLSEGEPAPAFQAQLDTGETISLADFAGRMLVIFFYPRANTPGCTREAIDFTQLADRFAAAGAAVLGISADSAKVQASFRAKQRLGIPLVADVDRAVIDAFGVWGEKSMYGKTHFGILRTTVLIGHNGKIARIWRNVRVDGHAEAVLQAIEEMSLSKN